jgi:hypothetical protein
VLAAWLLIACAGSPLGFGNDQCGDEPGSYPPPTITIVGTQPVAVPWTSWSCTGYASDTFEEPVPLPVESDTVRLDVPIHDGAELEVRVEQDGHWVGIEVDPAGESQHIVIPAAGTSLFVRLCTDDGRCANYEASLNRPD